MIKKLGKKQAQFKNIKSETMQNPNWLEGLWPEIPLRIC